MKYWGGHEEVRKRLLRTTEDVQKRVGGHEEVSMS